MIPEGFHFLRPAWLLALLPLALLIWAVARRDERTSAWRRLVDQHLLRHLLLSEGGAARRWPLVAAALGGVAACLAMAGPAWERIPQPTFSAVAPTVVVLEMSPTMSATDLSPSRLARARHKLHDILERTRGGQVGLVIYADEPFVAVPLTDDARVVEEMIPALERNIMPARPGRTDRAIAQAEALLDQAGAAVGRIVLISDGVDEHREQALAAAEEVRARGRTLSVIGAGTADGTPALDRAGLDSLAQAGGGSFAPLSVDDADLARVVPGTAAAASAEPEPGTEASASPAGSSAGADVWRDAGIWLVLVPLLLAPLAFRRGMLASLALGLLIAAPARAEASLWSDLWSRRDQQGEAALAAGDPAQAAGLFEDPAWQAAARYEAGDFAAAVEAYQELDGDENDYNRGNALARSGELEEAIAAYDEVLARAPDHADAKFNRDLLQSLLDQQRQQQQQQQSQEQGGGDDRQQQSSAGNGQESAQQQGDGDDDEQQQGTGGKQSASEPGAADAAQGEQHSEEDRSQGEQGSVSHDQAAGNEDARASSDEGASDEKREAPGQAGAGGSDRQQGDDQDTQQAARPAGDDREQAQGEDDTRPQVGRSGQAEDTRQAGAGRPRDDAAEHDRSLEERLDAALDGATDPDQTEPSAAPAHAGAGDAQQPMTEREQAREQMLRDIPDDPGGLLRAKIRRRYAEKRYSQQEVISPW